MLGTAALGAYAWHRTARGLGLTRRALPDQALPAAPYLGTDPLPPFACAPPLPHATTIAPLAGDDIRPVWETARWAELPLLPPDAADRHIAAFLAANPPYRGPHWVSAQEAAIRLLHLAWAALRHGRHAAPPPGLRALAALHWRRVRAERAYEAAQDNNHSLAAAAAGIAAGLLTDDPALSAAALRRTERVAARLIAPCGAFSQHSVRYQRMAVDLLSLAAALAMAQGLRPGFGAAHLAAATWLDWLRDPVSGDYPRIGHDDGTALTAPPPPAAPPRPGHWAGRGFMGFAQGESWAVLRLPGSRFRPAHADLLHLDLWRGGRNLLCDGGTGAYNPPPGAAWWLDHFPSVAAHNTIQFDAQPQIPRVGRFLMGPWPEGGTLPMGGWVRDAAGNRHERTIRPGTDWTITDILSGPFAQATLRWRLDPGQSWRPIPGGAETRATRIRVLGPPADDVRIAAGWISPAYGTVAPAPVLTATIPPGITRVETVIEAIIG